MIDSLLNTVYNFVTSKIISLISEHFILKSSYDETLQKSEKFKIKQTL